MKKFLILSLALLFSIASFANDTTDPVVPKDEVKKKVQVKSNVQYAEVYETLGVQDDIPYVICQSASYLVSYLGYGIWGVTYNGVTTLSYGEGMPLQVMSAEALCIAERFDPPPGN